MARPLRIQAPGLTYHVMARGVRRTSIYLDDDDRRRFLAMLEQVAARYGLQCHAYCEMTNHYHLALTTSDANLSRAIQQLNGEYAQWWNGRHDRAGHVFEARFRAQIVQDDAYLVTVCRYIVRNPVRAGVVSAPEEWPWSSFRATVGLAARPPFLSSDRLLALAAPGCLAEGTQRFREAVMAADPGVAVLPAATILGDDEFVARFQPLRARASREVPRHEGRRLLDDIFRGALTRRARDLAVMTAYRERFALAEIARHLELHPSTVSKIVSRSVPELE